MEHVAKAADRDFTDVRVLNLFKTGAVRPDMRSHQHVYICVVAKTIDCTT